MVWESGGGGTKCAVPLGNPATNWVCTRGEADCANPAAVCWRGVDVGGCAEKLAEMWEEANPDLGTLVPVLPDGTYHCCFWVHPLSQNCCFAESGHVSRPERSLLQIWRSSGFVYWKLVCCTRYSSWSTILSLETLHCWYPLICTAVLALIANLSPGGHLYRWFVKWVHLPFIVWCVFYWGSYCHMITSFLSSQDQISQLPTEISVPTESENFRRFSLLTTLSKTPVLCYATCTVSPTLSHLIFCEEMTNLCLFVFWQLFPAPCFQKDIQQCQSQHFQPVDSFLPEQYDPWAPAIWGNDTRVRPVQRKMGSFQYVKLVVLRRPL